VQVFAGVVTVAGTVESWAARKAAIEATHRVAGVLDVANKLEVRPTDGTDVTDADLADAARQALEGGALQPTQHVHVTVADGGITLAGTIRTLTDRTEAERAIQRLRGVRGVANKIEVRRNLEPSDLIDAIEAALARDAVRMISDSRLIFISRLRIIVEDGRVVVEGIVRSAAERRTILGTVHGTHGVAAADDRLVVETDAQGPE